MFGGGDLFVRDEIVGAALIVSVVRGFQYPEAASRTHGLNFLYDVFLEEPGSTP